ncbi:hypothetical protein BH10PSE7_BH10PSE7_35010 [soil metagenome]
MALLGPDFRAGLRHSQYRPENFAGLGWAISIFVALVIVNQVLAAGFGLALRSAFGGPDASVGESIKFLLAGLLPASLVTVMLAIILAQYRGGTAGGVLGLRVPALGPGGWVIAVLGFLTVMYLFIAVVMQLVSIEDGDIGVVETAMRELGRDPLYPVVAAAIAFGAPLAEELTFRGQIFAALSQTRLGRSGTAVLTSAAWAALHITEPLHAVALLFVMGLALSFLLVRFGSLWVPIACHMVWNAIVAYASFSLAPPL